MTNSSRRARRNWPGLRNCIATIAARCSTQRRQARVHDIKVDAVAETRLRVKVKSTSVVDEAVLTDSGIAGLAVIGEGTLHLLAGLNADEYAGEVPGQLAAVPARARDRSLLRATEHTA
jgi:PTS system glucose-specific IIC component